MPGDLYKVSLNPDVYSQIASNISQTLVNYCQQKLSDDFPLKELYINNTYQTLAIGLGGLAATGENAIRILTALGIEDWAAEGIARLAAVFTRYYTASYTLAFGNSDNLRAYRDIYMQGISASGIGWYLLSQAPQISGLDNVINRLLSLDQQQRPSQSGP